MRMYVRIVSICMLTQHTRNTPLCTDVYMVLKPSFERNTNNFVQFFNPPDNTKTF